MQIELYLELWSSSFLWSFEHLMNFEKIIDTRRCKVWLTRLASNLGACTSWELFPRWVWCQVLNLVELFSSAVQLRHYQPREIKASGSAGVQSDIFTNSFFQRAGKNNQNGPKQFNWKGIPWTLVAPAGNSEVFISISRSLSLIWQCSRDKKVQKGTASSAAGKLW